MNIKEKSTQKEFTLTKENYILLTIGLVIIVVGFFLMSGGRVTDPNAFYPNNDPTQTPLLFNVQRITIAPIMVIFGFAFEIFAIMANPESKLMKKLFGKQ
ncbi:MAG: DUF3098 domain-containing protein [Bacteroidales bacterium]|jgi:hypothetical protein|nr:DUF3098 domain-containing protein [Bacteroidales bacterium]